MKCENCNKEHDGSYASGRFCSKKCAKGFSTKAKRKEINAKVSKTLTKNKEIIKKCPVCFKVFTTKNNKKTCCSRKCGACYGGKLNKKYEKEHYAELICKECNQIFYVGWNKRKQQFCSNDCRHKNKEYREKLSFSMKKISESIEYKKRLRDIGRKGGFGKRGKTVNNTRYDSIIEKTCFEWLEENKIKFEAHKHIPNSSKISDIYLIEKDLWIEIDGINREKKKEWLGKDYNYWLDKLKIYEKQHLTYKICYNLQDLQNLF